MARPGQTTRGQLRVGRYLGFLFVLLVVLYAVVIFAGKGSAALKPKLGLDLRGGASVILTPQGLKGQKPSQTQLDTAVNIISLRVNGAGVSEAEVVTEGDQIVVSVPGGNRQDIDKVTKTAALRFREVLEAVPVGLPRTPPTSGNPSATPSAAPSASLAPKPGAVKPSATPRKRPLTAGLLAAATPKPTLKPAVAATPSPSQTSTGDVLTVRSGDTYTPQAFAALDCSNTKARLGGGLDDPKTAVVACNREGTEKYHLDVSAVQGDEVKGANVGTDANGIQIQVNVQFTGKGQDKFTKLTQKTLNKRVAVDLDGVVYSAPTIQSVIPGDAQITGGFTQKEATDLANVLKFGALPLTFQAGETNIVSPTLGGDQLRSGLLAGGLGLIAVVLYSLLYYRALGFVTIASLLTSAALTYAMVCILGKQIGFALSLAGIAGFIVAIGITADSFVVFFERLKDEIKEGRTPRSAVDRAWVRARRTILSADTVSFLAAVILYFVSVGGVRGFAFTLGLSTLLDVLVVFLFTRPLLSLLSHRRWFSRSRLTGFHGPDGGEPSVGGPRRTAQTSGSILADPTPLEA